jgi:hypothetical protein
VSLAVSDVVAVGDAARQDAVLVNGVTCVQTAVGK